MNPEANPTPNLISSANTTTPKITNRKKFLGIQIIIVVIQASILLLHFTKHGYVYSTNRPLNGYQMEKYLTVLSTLLLLTIAIINIASKKTNKKLQTVFIFFYLLSIPLLFIDNLKYACFDTCSRYVNQPSFGGELAYMLYLATFPFIVASRIVAGKAQNTQNPSVPETETN